MSRFFRKESPPLFEDQREYRPYLRRDFRCVCAYCERTETGLGGQEFFEIDHFRPIRKFPEQSRHYPNLYYACGMCNRHKGGAWPTVGLAARGFRFADPCEEDMYLTHLQDVEDGHVRALTACGEYTWEHIGLNRPDVVSWRLEKRQARTELRDLGTLLVHLESLAAAGLDPAVQEEIRNGLAALQFQITQVRVRFGL